MLKRILLLNVVMANSYMINNPIAMFRLINNYCYYYRLAPITNKPDLQQEIWLSIYKHIHTFPLSSGSEKIKYVKRDIAKFCRRIKKQPYLNDMIDIPSPDIPVYNNFKDLKCFNILKKDTEAFQVFILLSDGYTINEISDELRYTPSRVYRIKQRIKRMIRISDLK